MSSDAQALHTQHIKKEDEDVQKEYFVESHFMGWHWCHGYVATTSLGHVALGISSHTLESPERSPGGLFFDPLEQTHCIPLRKDFFS